MALSGARLAFLGSGNMAEALVKGLLAAKAVQSQQVVTTARRQHRLDLLHTRYGVRTSLSNSEAVRDADVVVLAVKPQIIEQVLDDIAPSLVPNALVISVAAGFALSQIQKSLGEDAHLCRAMPNTPALVGEGATAFCVGDKVSPEQIVQCETIFSAVGLAIQLDESLLDAVTGLSGSGPAYVFMIIEALSDAGVKVGLPRHEALQLAAQTVLGSARLLIQTAEHPGVLKDRVTSPGGTAIAGLHTLEQGGLRTTLINAVEAATTRAQELGGIHKKK
jgi:pyrroline-5-carboxylate reductase